jgi:hypothetical protein
MVFRCGIKNQRHTAMDGKLDATTGAASWCQHPCVRGMRVSDQHSLPSVSVVLDPESGQVLKKVHEVKGEYSFTTPCGVTFTPSGMLCVADR